MPQRTNSRSSPKTIPNAAETGTVSPPSKSASKPRLSERGIDTGLSRCIGPCKTDEENALDRPVTPLEAPRGWEPELSDFDFTASPGADEWQIGKTADGCAVYSTVGSAGAGVKVEFQKWDW